MNDTNSTDKETRIEGMVDWVFMVQSLLPTNVLMFATAQRSHRRVCSLGTSALIARECFADGLSGLRNASVEVSVGTRPPVPAAYRGRKISGLDR